MAQIIISHKEVVEALVRARGIKEGIWGLYVEFGIAAVNAGPDADSILPAAVVPVMKLGLQNFDEITNISIDASKLRHTTGTTEAKPKTSKKAKSE